MLTPDRRAGWLLAGIGFSLLGASWVVQNVGAVAAFFSGAGTPTYETYLRWAPAMNHSRLVLGTAFAGAMACVAWSGRFPGRRGWSWMVAAMVAAMLAGGALGLLEGSYDSRVHTANAAVLLTVELIAFSVVLLIAAARGTLDVFLFAALMLYTASMALSVPQLSAMSLFAATGGQRALPWLMQLQSVVFGVLMLGVAILRLELLRRGAPVREVFGRASTPRLRFLAPDGGSAPARAPRSRPRRHRSRRSR
ncbi:MAG TPA: hypothetical protein VGR37_21365 [Longimicrobiaceae bacterium]|nr:hypothetical protein [Longimicrobiaceae bacterium]